uniref:Zinc/iron permease n=1 Tax=Elaeophora elaphi TaxID=1147741 RepID=A0A0R3RH23_9BILA
MINFSLGHWSNNYNDYGNHTFNLYHNCAISQKKTLYEPFMTLLVAFGIRTLSGSTLYVLLPGAPGLNIVEQSYQRTKIFILSVILYAFFAMDRIFAYALHFRNLQFFCLDLIKRAKSSSINVEQNPGKRQNSKSTTGTEDNFMAPRIILTSENNDSTEDDNLEYYELGKNRLKAYVDIELEVATVTNMISRKKDPNNEVAVNVEVLEEKVLDPTKLDVATVAWMIIFGSSMNNFFDGMSNGAAFANSLARGFSVGIAVTTQQFPQEIGVLAILIQSGLGFKRTLLLSLFPNPLSYLGFIVGVLIGKADDSYGNYIFAVSSGMYLYVFLGTLIPEIRDSVNEQIKVDLKRRIRSTALQAIGIIAGTLFIYLICTYGHENHMP